MNNRTVNLAEKYKNRVEVVNLLFNKALHEKNEAEHKKQYLLGLWLLRKEDNDQANELKNKIWIACDIWIYPQFVTLSSFKDSNYTSNSPIFIYEEQIQALEWNKKLESIYLNENFNRDSYCKSKETEYEKKDQIYLEQLEEILGAQYDEILKENFTTSINDVNKITIDAIDNSEVETSTAQNNHLADIVLTNESTNFQQPPGEIKTSNGSVQNFEKFETSQFEGTIESVVLSFDKQREDIITKLKQDKLLEEENKKAIIDIIASLQPGFNLKQLRKDIANSKDFKGWDLEYYELLRNLNYIRNVINHNTSVGLSNNETLSVAQSVFTRSRPGWVEQFHLNYTELSIQEQVEKFINKIEALLLTRNPPKYVGITYSSNEEHTKAFFAAERNHEVPHSIVGEHQAKVINGILKKLHATHQHLLPFVKIVPVTTCKNVGLGIFKKRVPPKPAKNKEELERANDFVEEGGVLLAWTNQDSFEKGQFCAISGGKVNDFPNEELVQSTVREINIKYQKPSENTSELLSSEHISESLKNAIYQRYMNQLDNIENSPCGSVDSQNIRVNELLEKYFKLILSYSLQSQELDPVKEKVHEILGKIKLRDDSEKINHIIEVAKLACEAFQGIAPRLSITLQALKYEMETLKQIKEKEQIPMTLYCDQDTYEQSSDAQKLAHMRMALILHQKTAEQQEWLLSIILPILGKVADTSIKRFYKDVLSNLHEKSIKSVATPFRDFLGYYLTQCVAYAFANNANFALQMAIKLAHCSPSREGLKKIGEEARSILAVLKSINSNDNGLIKLMEMISKKEEEYRWHVELPAKTIIAHANYDAYDNPVEITITPEKKEKISQTIRETFNDISNANQTFLNSQPPSNLIKIASKINDPDLDVRLTKQCAMITELIYSENIEERKIGLSLVQKTVPPELIETMRAKKTNVYEKQRRNYFYYAREKVIDDIQAEADLKNKEIRLAGLEEALTQLSQFNSIDNLREKKILPEQSLRGNSEYQNSSHFIIQCFLIKVVMQKTNNEEIKTQLIDDLSRLLKKPLDEQCQPNQLMEEFGTLLGNNRNYLQGKEKLGGIFGPQRLRTLLDKEIDNIHTRFPPSNGRYIL